MGLMDCLTTVIGTLYFGTQELNPLIADLVYSNLPAFVVLKMAVSFSVGAVFVLAEKTLRGGNGKNDEKSFRFAHNMLRAAYIGITVFLAMVVTNNIFVLLRTLTL
jgi:hypothetical protein